MKPSNAAITSSRFSIACGFSILAMTGSMTPSSRMIRRTSSASLASRTKLSAMKSTLRCSAKRRSSMSFSDSAGTETATPGRLMPLWLLTLPPTSTSVRTSWPSTSVTRSRTLPSSMRIGSPTLTSPGSPSYVVPATWSSPGTSRVVMVHSWPRSSVTGPSAKVAEPDLGALEVGEDADAVPARVRGLAHQAVGLGVVLVGAVAHVQPGDVHAGVHQLTDAARGGDGRAEGADDLGFAHAGPA